VEKADSSYQQEEEASMQLKVLATAASSYIYSSS